MPYLAYDSQSYVSLRSSQKLGNGACLLFEVMSVVSLSDPSFISFPHRDNLDQHGELNNNTWFSHDTWLSIFLHPRNELKAE